MQVPNYCLLATILGQGFKTLLTTTLTFVHFGTCLVCFWEAVHNQQTNQHSHLNNRRSCHLHHLMYSVAQFEDSFAHFWVLNITLACNNYKQILACWLSLCLHFFNCESLDIRLFNQLKLKVLSIDQFVLVDQSVLNLKNSPCKTGLAILTLWAARENSFTYLQQKKLSRRGRDWTETCTK